MQKLNNRHIAFIDEYMVNGYNSVQAYLKVYPNASYDSANTLGPKLLGNVRVKAEIERRQLKERKKYDLRREDLIQSNLVHEEAFDKLLELATKPKLTAEEESIFARMMMVVKAADAIRARDMNAKLVGLYKQDDEGKDIGDIKIDVQIRRNKNGDTA